MNIIVCVNAVYIPHLKVMLHSLRRNNREPITVYLLNHSLTNIECEELCIWASGNGMRMEIVDVTKTALDYLPVIPGVFSIEMYYRILVQYILPQEVDRALWLDADLVTLGNLTEFYHQDFADNYLAVCPDRNADSPHVIEIKERVGIPSSHTYFNSGVLLLNLERLRNLNTYDEILKKIRNIVDRVTYPDQDILNYIYANKVKYNDWKVYNYQLLGDAVIPHRCFKHVRILHYTSVGKPWNKRYFGPSSLPYWHEVWRMGRYRKVIVFLCTATPYRIFIKIRSILQKIYHSA